MHNLHALSERIRGDEFSGTIAVGQRVRAGIRGHDGIVVAIRGQQHPETVRHLAGVISMGGSAEFDVVFSNGSVSTRLPEAILRGSQWHIYDLIADAQEIAVALAFADMTSAKKNEEAQIESERRIRERDRIVKDYPYLKQTSAQESSCVTAARNIRTELARAFPEIKFSVRRAGFDRIDVSWLEGPTASEVREIGNKYEAGYFDGTQDMYVFSHDVWSEVFGGVRYVFEYRSFSDGVYHTLTRDLSALNNLPYAEGDLNTQDIGDRQATDIIDKVLAKTGIPAGHRIAGLERTDCTCGLIEEFYRITLAPENDSTKDHPKSTGGLDEKNP